MDLPRDELRRQLRDLEDEHRTAMPRWRSALMRLLVDDRSTPAGHKAELLLGGFNRRRFLALSGVAAGATVLAACGDDDDDDAAAPTTTTTAPDGGAGNETDVTVARTSASLENFAVVVYDGAIANAEAIGIPAEVGAAAQVFRDQHDAHAEAFNGAAEQLGGEPFTEPNPTALEQYKATVEAVNAGEAAPGDVLRFAYDLEVIASQTYQGVGVDMLSTPELRQTAMSVGGVEARHAALLAMFIDNIETVPNAFQPTEQAVSDEFFV